MTQQDRLSEAMLDAIDVGPERACACGKCRSCRLAALAWTLAGDACRELNAARAREDNAGRLGWGPSFD